MAQPTYRSVEAAIIRWKGGDLATAMDDELELLRHTFRLFDFGVTNIEIPKEDSQAQLETKLQAFYEKTAKKRGPILAIVFYAGHGSWDEEGMTFGRDQDWLVNLNWSQVQNNIVCGPAGTKFDQLLVIDACYAGMAADQLSGQLEDAPLPHKLDYIVAVDHGETYANLFSLARTFTAALEAIEAEGEPFSVAAGPRSLWSVLNVLQARRVEDGEYYVEREASGVKRGKSHAKKRRERLWRVVDYAWEHPDYVQDTFNYHPMPTTQAEDLLLKKLR